MSRTHDSKVSKLSFSKFVKLLTQHNYIINVLYFVSDVDAAQSRKFIKFIEARLPKTQKIIIIHISSQKYTMSLPDDTPYKTIEIVSVHNEGIKDAAFLLTDQSLQYLLNIRGPLIESDLVALSSDGICYSRFNGENQCYFLESKIKKISEDTIDLEDNEIAKEEVDEIYILENEINTIAKGEGVALEKIEYETIVEEAKVVEEITETPDEKIELEFVDAQDEEDVQDEEEGEEEEEEEGEEEEGEEEEGEEEEEDISVVDSEASDVTKEEDDKTPVITLQPPPTKLKDGTNTTNIKESVVPVKNITKKDDIANEKVMKLSHRSNYVIPDELDVYYGVIFVAINITDLFKIISSYETDALSVYEQIEDNEKDMRVSRLSNIQSNLALATKHIDLRSKEIDIQERSLKYQLLRLTGVLHNIDEVKQKIPQTVNSKPDTSIIGSALNNQKGLPQIISNPKLLEMDRLYNKTRKTIHEINVQLIRHRDEFEDLFSNYEYMINELLNS